MLTLNNINYEVEGNPILRDISLELVDEFVAVTSPNGSGKSTLAKVITGFLH